MIPSHAEFPVIVVDKQNVVAWVCVPLASLSVQCQETPGVINNDSGECYAYSPGWLVARRISRETYFRIVRILCPKDSANVSLDSGR